MLFFFAFGDPAVRVSGVFRFKVGEPQGTLGCFGFRGLGFRV